jgi:hypothetical protein
MGADIAHLKRPYHSDNFRNHLLSLSPDLLSGRLKRRTFYQTPQLNATGRMVFPQFPCTCISFFPKYLSVNIGLHIDGWVYWEWYLSSGWKVSQLLGEDLLRVVLNRWFQTVYKPVKKWGFFSNASDTDNICGWFFMNLNKRLKLGLPVEIRDHKTLLSFTDSLYTFLQNSLLIST